MMSLIKRFNHLRSFNPELSHFLGADDLTIDRLWKNIMTPTVNISEDDKKFQIEFTVPGISNNHFEITVYNGILTVSSGLKKEEEKRKKLYTRQEYSYSAFSRSCTLPDNAKDDVKASYENGILNLRIAKKEIACSKRKEIEIS